MNLLIYIYIWKKNLNIRDFFNNVSHNKVWAYVCIVLISIFFMQFAHIKMVCRN